MNNIFEDLKKENCYSCERWGDDFDRYNTINDWVSYITQYAGKAVDFKLSKDEQRKYLIKVANLAISAIKSCDKNNGFPKRHYD